MYHQVEVRRVGGDHETKVYWLWVHHELRTGEGVIILEESDIQYWTIERTFMSLQELATLPQRVRLGHIEPRGDEHESYN